MIFLKNPTVAVFFAALIAVVAYAVFISLPSLEKAPAPAYAEPPTLCQAGQTQYCSSGPCPGLSTCFDGVWSGCRWDTVCTPGERVPCLKGGCSYAVKECNECGTGYTVCFNP